MGDAGSSSFLLRLWHEPAGERGAGSVRCYLRNLRTGEEEYLSSPDEVQERVLRAAIGGAEKGHPRGGEGA